ncbi:large conductance mechanosensitive channel protein MscL [Empedobacter brevis]|uniref:large conductance mechanosensitive channel protein MscL n=1 Tax=Empedobacter brevis TaxID=247 RepID=UPI0039AF5855
MGFFKEFKEFAVKGNVVDLAVGVVIGGAFGKIITSLVEDIITPALLNPALKAINAENLSELVVPGTAIKYGSFLAATISFIVVAFALFLMIKGINKLKREEPAEEAAPAGPSQEELLSEIRDLLKNK